jgi:hypothetical protein
MDAGALEWRRGIPRRPALDEPYWLLNLLRHFLTFAPLINGHGEP